WSRTLAPTAAALLNLAEDHLEWHGSFAAYVAAKREIWRGVPPGTAVGNLDDPRVVEILPARRVGFTLHPPGPGQLGVVDGVLVDHAYADPPVELAPVDLVRPAGRHNVANALAAAALA